MSKRNVTELLDGDPDSERPSTKQRRRSPTPPQAYALTYPAAGAAPAFQQPTQIISFSYTPARELEFTDSALRFLASPPPRAQLTHGYDSWVRRPETRPRIDGLLRALSAARAKRHPALANGVGAVGWRGVLTRILTAPYEERDGWDMNVMRVNDVLYFEEHLTEEKLREKDDIPPRQRLQTYMGYAFESYCTSATPSSSNPPGVNVPQGPGDPPGWSGDVDTNVQWCSVVRTKLGETRLVIGGEVDCVRGKYTSKTDTFVELKTSMVIRNPQDEMRFEKKLLKFYMQSFLLGVPEILVGFRTPGGEVTTTQTFRTVEIPRLVRGKAHGWDPGRCLAWGEAFLEFLKKHVRVRRELGDRGEGTGEERHENGVGGKGEDETTHPDAVVWRVTFRPGVGVELRQLDDAAVRDVKGGEEGGVKDGKEKVERVGFLPRWYWEEVTATSNGVAAATSNGNGAGAGQTNGG
ncbi:RAI1 domain-containing protein [Mycena sanguinolenta]|uniref:Decapping nuclease n=1 Tax=Mycena sanguinolenta TaxID=230812 RepID=A0A8H7DGN1_9AGAR|nr:RAI1 domain-containing protein [Mycena sanguinolenta]